MKCIFIIGYMASGKTTFGRALAREIGWNFIDLDFYIEQRFHKTIREIFATEGENKFRNIETAMLKEVGEFENTVVSCGGGTPCYFDNMEYMNRTGYTVFLDTTTECLVKRLVVNNSRRPLMAGKSALEIREQVEKGLITRRPFYSRALIHFGGDNLEDLHQIEDSISEFRKILEEKEIINQTPVS